jgi:hypothetical protein
MEKAMPITLTTSRARSIRIVVLLVAFTVLLVPAMPAPAVQTMQVPIASDADDWYHVPPSSAPYYGSQIRVGGWDPNTNGYDVGHFRFSFLRMPSNTVQSATLHVTAAENAKWPIGANLLVDLATNPCPPPGGGPVFGCGDPVGFKAWTAGNTYSIDVTSLLQDFLADAYQNSATVEMVYPEFLLKPGVASPLVVIEAREAGAKVAATLEIVYG